MTTIFQDTFAGSNGSAWNPTYWLAPVVSAGGTATQQGGKGRVVCGAGGYTSYVALGTVGTYVDSILAGTFTIVGNFDGIVELDARCDVPFNPSNTYLAEIGVYGTPTIGKLIAGSYTQLAPTSFTVSHDVAYKFKYRVAGTTIQLKLWDASVAEPGSYNMTATDAALSGAAKTSMKIRGGGDPGMVVEFDNISLTDGSATPPDPSPGVLPMSTSDTEFARLVAASFGPGSLRDMQNKELAANPTTSITDRRFVAWAGSGSMTEKAIAGGKAWVDVDDSGDG